MTPRTIVFSWILPWRKHTASGSFFCQTTLNLTKNISVFYRNSFYKASTGFTLFLSVACLASGIRYDGLCDTVLCVLYSCIKCLHLKHYMYALLGFFMATIISPRNYISIYFQKISNNVLEEGAIISIHPHTPDNCF